MDAPPEAPQPRGFSALCIAACAGYLLVGMTAPLFNAKVRDYYNSIGITELPTPTALVISIPFAAYLWGSLTICGLLLWKERIVKERAVVRKVNRLVLVFLVVFALLYSAAMALPRIQIQTILNS